MTQDALKLSEHLLHLISERPGLSAAEIISAFKSRGKTYSRSGIFKELGALQKRGIIVKKISSYNLSLSWALSANEKAQKFLNSCLRKSYLQQFVPAPGGNVKWKFSSFIVLNEFWNQVILSLFEASQQSLMYEWNPHSWYALLQPETEIRLRRAIGFLDRRVKIIIGGDSYLDRIVTDIHGSEVYTYSFANSPFSKFNLEHIGLVGDYVLKIKLLPETCRMMMKLYQECRNAGDVSVPQLISFLTSPTKLKLSVEHNTAKAQRLRAQFERFWGKD
jgi:hypothetical protein